MDKESTHKSLLLPILVWCALAAISQAAAPAPEPPAPPLADGKPVASATPPASVAQAPAAISTPLQIWGLGDRSSGLIDGKRQGVNADIQSRVGLNGKLWVVLNQPPPISPDQYALSLEWRPGEGPGTGRAECISK